MISISKKTARAAMSALQCNIARKDAFGQVEPAAALTIHKSQGSTYRHVFLHPDVDGFNANPAPIHGRLAYVGVTRAAETLHVIADKEVG